MFFQCLYRRLVYFFYSSVHFMMEQSKFPKHTVWSRRIGQLRMKFIYRKRTIRIDVLLPTKQFYLFWCIKIWSLETDFFQMCFELLLSYWRFSLVGSYRNTWKSGSRSDRSQLSKLGKGKFRSPFARHAVKCCHRENLCLTHMLQFLVHFI